MDSTGYTPKGVIANVFTVFNPDQSIDWEGQSRFIDSLASWKAIDAYFVRSGMGQMYTFDMAESRRMIELACGLLEGVAPVVAGVSGIWNRDPGARPDPKVYLEQAIALTRHAQECGAAAAVHVVPDGIAPATGQTPADVTAWYFEAVAAASSLPLLAYQPPAITSEFAMTPETLQRIARIPSLRGIKVSTGDAGYILDLCLAVQGTQCKFIVGNETAYYAGLCCGATAVIGQGACISPAILRAVHEHFSRHELNKAMEAQASVNRLVRDIGKPVAFLKRFFSERGGAIGETPRTSKDNPGMNSQSAPLTPEEYAAAKNMLLDELARWTR